MSEKNIIKKSALSPTALIVGGAGFIGSHLAEALLMKDARVIVVDNFSTGKDIYVHSLLENPKFALYNADVNQGVPGEIQSVDYIFHLAALETYLFDKGDLNLDTLLTNALGTKNVLDFCRKSEAKFLLASSTDVYKGLISPLSLDQYFGQTQQEEKKYSLAEAKRYAEALVWEYYKLHHADVRIARFPEIYGPRMNLEASGGLGLLLKSLIDNKDLVVVGEGVEKEYYLFISDTVSALVKALFSEESKGKIYTFTPKDTHAVLETTYLVKSLANKETRVVFKPKIDVLKPRKPIIPDRTNFKDLGWEEKESFKGGIVKTLKWFGYEPNEHAFKPGKLIKDKKLERSGQAVSSIVSEQGQFVPADSTGHLLWGLSLKPILSKMKGKLKSIVHRSNLTGVEEGKSGETKMSKNIRVFKIAGAYLFLGLFALLIFVGVPTLQTYIHSLSGKSDLIKVQTLLSSLESENAQKYSNDAFREFFKAQKSLNRVKWVFSVTGKEDYFRDVQRVLSAAGYSSKATYFLAKGSVPFADFWATLSPNSDQTFEKEQFDISLQSFLDAKDNLELARAELNQVNFERFPDIVKGYSTPVEEFSEKMDVLVEFVTNVPDLVGLDGKKKYLLLFQNSSELRPTGGFIGSYATLELENGKISSLAIDDIYNPDGQIDLREIQVSSPTPIKEHLEEEFLHIRNANWDPSFPSSAEKIEDLFFRLDGREYDGIIAVDLQFVESILRVSGPVFLAAYNEEITAENLYERAQFHSEFSYQEGSEQKRSFLTILGGKILERLFSLKNENLFALGIQIQNSLDEKHLLVHIPNNPLSALLDERGWNGRLVETEGDYLYVVNANLGGTKANYYVKNEMSYDVFSATRDGLLRAELTLLYDHTGEDNTWPGGPYTNYVRVLTQDGTKLTGAKIIFSDGSEEDLFEKVILNNVGPYTSFEIVFELQPQQQSQLIFMYDLPETLVLTKESTNYTLYWQKQPGTKDDKAAFKFNAPFGFEIVRAKPNMTLGANSVEMSGVLNTDLVIDVLFR